MATSTCTCGKLNWIDTGLASRCARCGKRLREGAAMVRVEPPPAVPRCTRCGTTRRTTNRPCPGCGWDADAQRRKCRSCAGPLETWSPLSGAWSRTTVVGGAAALLGALGLRAGAPVVLAVAAGYGIAAALTTKVRCGRCGLAAPAEQVRDRGAEVRGRRVQHAALALICGGAAAGWELLPRLLRQLES